MQDKYLQLFDNSVLAYLSLFVTRGRVMDKLIYIVTTCSCRYEKAHNEGIRT